MQIGSDFFPSVDAGQIRLHVRCPAGTRIEETERLFADVEAVIREIIPADEIDIVLDNIGLPAGGINLAFSDASLVDVRRRRDPRLPEARPRTDGALRRATAEDAARAVPGARRSSSSPPTSSAQILNFGLPAPIDVQIVGRDPQQLAIARGSGAAHRGDPGRRRRAPAPGAALPGARRRRRPQRGASARLQRRDVAQSLLVSLSGDRADAAELLARSADNGVNYPVAVQTPQYRIDSIDALARTPIAVPAPRAAAAARQPAPTIERGVEAGV